MVVEARNPMDVRDWQATALVVTVVVAPQLAILLMAPELRSLSDAASVSGVMELPMIGFAAVGIYLYSRLTLCRGIARVYDLPPRAAYRLALAVVAVCVNWAAVGYVNLGSAEALPSAIGLASGLVGAVLLVDTCLALLRLGVRADPPAVSALQDQLVALNAKGRSDLEKLHEIKSGVAGIASAVRLIRHGSLPQSLRRDQLEEMLAQEADRLERLMGRSDDGPPDESKQGALVDLDQTIRPLVVAQRARGRLIHWQPSGQTAQGRQDDIAQVINILLENAAQHAPSAPAGIDVRHRNGTIEIEVSDQGPGVPPGMQARLFEWGVRGAHSSGEGIGLNVAHRLMDDAGASLRLVSSPTSGATFVVGLRTEGDSGDTADSA
jgi:signal transduction histidine kinase